MMPTRLSGIQSGRSPCKGSANRSNNSLPSISQPNALEKSRHAPSPPSRSADPHRSGDQRLEQGKLAAGGRRDEAATEGGDPRPRPEGGGQGGLQTGRGHVVGHVMEVPTRGGRLHEAVVPTGKVVRQRGVDLGRGDQFAVG